MIVLFPLVYLGARWWQKCETLDLLEIDFFSGSRECVLLSLPLLPREVEADDATMTQQRRDARIGRQEQVEEGARGDGLSAATVDQRSSSISLPVSLSRQYRNDSIRSRSTRRRASLAPRRRERTESYRIAIPPTPRSTPPTPPSPAPLPLTLNGSASRPVLSR